MIYKRLKFFDKDEIVWKNDKIFDLYKKLTHLKSFHPALKEGALILPIETDVPNSIMAFSISEENKKVILLLNLSEKESTFYLKCENLSDKTFLNLLSETIIQYSCHQQFSLMPYDYLILGQYFVRMFFKIDSQLGLSNLSISFRK